MARRFFTKGKGIIVVEIASESRLRKIEVCEIEGEMLVVFVDKYWPIAIPVFEKPISARKELFHSITEHNVHVMSIQGEDYIPFGNPFFMDQTSWLDYTKQDSVEFPNIAIDDIRIANTLDKLWYAKNAGYCLEKLHGVCMIHHIRIILCVLHAEIGREMKNIMKSFFHLSVKGCRSDPKNPKLLSYEKFKNKPSYAYGALSEISQIVQIHQVTRAPVILRKN